MGPAPSKGATKDSCCSQIAQVRAQCSRGDQVGGGAEQFRQASFQRAEFHQAHRGAQVEQQIHVGPGLLGARRDRAETGLREGCQAWLSSGSRHT